jgi:tetratricopeptide (TPR) repeat protein
VSTQVFISHSSKDSKFARAICSALESRGLPCWISSRDVGPGESFMDAIVHAIGAAKVMVLVFSENANNSDDIKREIVLASSAKVTIIPVRVEDVVPKGAFAYQLATRQWIDLFEDWEAQIERLAKWIAGATSATSKAQANAEPEKTIPDSPAIDTDRMAEENGQRQADVEARQREERSRQDVAAKRSAEEEAFAATKRANAVDAVDAFLASHPASPYTAEAQTLRATLMERGEARNTAVEKSSAPTSNAATFEQTPDRSRKLEPRKGFLRSRVFLLIGVIAVGLVIWAGVGVIKEMQRENDPLFKGADWLQECQNVSAADAIQYCNRAIAEYDNAIRLTPNNVIAFNNRGLAYAAKKDYDRAIADFNAEIKLDPNGPAGFSNRGNAYEAKQDYDRAIADYSEAIKLDSSNVATFNNRGLAYENKRDYDRAIADYSEAIRLAPNNVAEFSNRGLSYYNKRDYDRAIADFSEAIKLDPTDSETLTYRANAYQAKKDYDRAIADYSEAIRLTPNDAPTFNNRGVAYDAKGDDDRAIADYNQAIKLDPKYVQAWSNVGDAYYNKQDYDRAIASYSEAIKLDPTEATPLYHRGLAKQRKGDNAGGRADIAAAKKLDSNVDK